MYCSAGGCEYLPDDPYEDMPCDKPCMVHATNPWSCTAAGQRPAGQMLSQSYNVEE